MKVTISKQTDYKQCYSYKDNKLFHTRLKQAKAIDLRNNADFIDLGNGYGKLDPKDSKKIYKIYDYVITRVGEQLITLLLFYYVSKPENKNRTH